MEAKKKKALNEKDPKKSIEVKLTDDGQAGDRLENDHVFSQKIPSQVFGIFRVVIEAGDALGNKTVHDTKDLFVLH